MAKRKLIGEMTAGEQIAGTVLFVLYLLVLPFAVAPMFALAGRLLGITISASLQNMVAVADPTEYYSAARYALEASGCVDDILSRGKLPIVVGGTGLYLDALVRGHGFAGGRAGGEIRIHLQERLHREGIGPLLAELAQVDPDAAARLHPADEKRILRALEVYLETGRTITAHNEESKTAEPRYDAVWIGLQFREREDMKRLIDHRVDDMVASGLLEEVRRLLGSGIPRDATALQAIGYKEFLGVADGQISADEAIAEVKRRMPELPYFDESFAGEYPKEAPFTIRELETLYPEASARSKTDEAFAAKAHDATYALQTGRRGYRALWQKIMSHGTAYGAHLQTGGYSRLELNAGHAFSIADASSPVSSDCTDAAEFQPAMAFCGALFLSRSPRRRPSF